MPAPKNPFPGMNPYLQESWSDVHTKLISCIGDALAGDLPQDLTSRTQEYVAVEGDEKVRSYRTDVDLIESWRAGFPPVDLLAASANCGMGGGTLAVAEPLLFIEEAQPERWIEIRSARGELITVIGVLSPANKSSDGENPYRKRQHHFSARGSISSRSISCAAATTSSRFRASGSLGRRTLRVTSSASGAPSAAT